MVFTKWGWWVGNITLKCISCFFSSLLPTLDHYRSLVTCHQHCRPCSSSEPAISRGSNCSLEPPLGNTAPPSLPSSEKEGWGRQGRRGGRAPTQECWGLRRVTLRFYLAAKPVAHWFWDGAPCPRPWARVLDRSVGLCAPSLSGSVESL